jgi:hypothetical protein
MLSYYQQSWLEYFITIFSFICIFYLLRTVLLNKSYRDTMYIPLLFIIWYSITYYLVFYFTQ